MRTPRITYRMGTRDGKVSFKGQRNSPSRRRRSDIPNSLNFTVYGGAQGGVTELRKYRLRGIFGGPQVGTLEFSISDGLQFRYTTYKAPPVRLHAASTVLSELILTLHSAAATSGTIASRLSGIARAVFVVLPFGSARTAKST